MGYSMPATLQQTGLLTREIDWRLRCVLGAGEHSREDIGTSMLIAEELEPTSTYLWRWCPWKSWKTFWTAPATARW